MLNLDVDLAETRLETLRGEVIKCAKLWTHGMCTDRLLSETVGRYEAAEERLRELQKGSR